MDFVTHEATKNSYTTDFFAQKGLEVYPGNLTNREALLFQANSDLLEVTGVG